MGETWIAAACSAAHRGCGVGNAVVEVNKSID
jgi:hypothetical protein